LAFFDVAEDKDRQQPPNMDARPVSSTEVGARTLAMKRSSGPLRPATGGRSTSGSYRYPDLSRRWSDDSYDRDWNDFSSSFDPPTIFGSECKCANWTSCIASVAKRTKTNKPRYRKYNPLRQLRTKGFDW